jgi:hypothetical protein
MPALKDKNPRPAVAGLAMTTWLIDKISPRPPGHQPRCR